MFARRSVGGNSGLGSSVSQIVQWQQGCEERFGYGREQLLRTREVFWQYQVPRDQLTEEVFATLLARGNQPQNVLDELRALFLKEIDAVSQYYQESLRAGRLPTHSSRPTGRELFRLSSEELMNLLLYNIDPSWLERFYCPYLLQNELHHDYEVAAIMGNNINNNNNPSAENNNNIINNNATNDNNNNNTNNGTIGKVTPTSPLIANAGSSKAVGEASVQTSAYQFEDMEVRNILSRGVTLQDVLINRELLQLDQQAQEMSSKFVSEEEGERGAQSEIVFLLGQDLSDYDEDELSTQSDCRFFYETRRYKTLPLQLIANNRTLDRKLLTQTSIGSKKPISSANVELSADLVGKLRNWFQVTETYTARKKAFGDSMKKLRFWDMDDVGFVLKKRRRIRLWKFIKKLFFLKSNKPFQRMNNPGGKVLCLVSCAAPKQHANNSSFDSNELYTNV